MSGKNGLKECTQFETEQNLVDCSWMLEQKFVSLSQSQIRWSHRGERWITPWLFLKIVASDEKT